MPGAKRKDPRRQKRLPMAPPERRRALGANSDSDESAPRKRFRETKRHQQEEKLISSDLSAKILREAAAQQEEIEREAEVRNSTAFSSLDENGLAADGEEDDVDDFDGFSETQSLYGNVLDEIDEEDENVLTQVMAAESADKMIQKIREEKAKVAAGTKLS